MKPPRLRRCFWCHRRLPLLAFPPNPNAPRGPSRSRYCSGYWEIPIAPELQVLRLRYAVAVLSRRWAQPSLFPDLVERVMVEELAGYRRELAELEAADEKG